MPSATRHSAFAIALAGSDGTVSTRKMLVAQAPPTAIIFGRSAMDMAEEGRW